ncbi:MAG: hypothetical protein ACPLYF_00885, partial [Fervidobacterium sp.]
KLTATNERRLEKEEVFHKHLERFPEIIAEALDPDSPRKFIVLKKEAGVTGGSIDLLLLDQNYVLMVVEVKRAESIDLRRKIIGQGIEYAANLVIEWTTGEIVSKARNYWAEKGKDLLEVINTTFEPEEPIKDDNLLIQKVQEKIENLHIIFAADGPFPNELKAAIEFLNKNLKSIRVYGLEVRYFGEEKGAQIITPLLIGRTAEAEAGKPTIGKKWTEEMFLSELKKQCEDDSDKIRVVKELLKFSKDEGSKNPFEKSPSVLGNFNFYIREENKDYALFSVYASGNIYFYGLQKRDRFGENLKEIGFEINKEDKEKTASLNILKDQTKMIRFKELVRTYKKHA